MLLSINYGNIEKSLPFPFSISPFPVQSIAFSFPILVQKAVIHYSNVLKSTIALKCVKKDKKNLNGPR